jgi:hypothetical protein
MRTRTTRMRSGRCGLPAPDRLYVVRAIGSWPKQQPVCSRLDQYGVLPEAVMPKWTAKKQAADPHRKASPILQASRGTGRAADEIIEARKRRDEHYTAASGRSDVSRRFMATQV